LFSYNITNMIKMRARIGQTSRRQVARDLRAPSDRVRRGRVEMIGAIGDMPAGTLGLEASGKLSREDYADVLEPALKRGTESGELRLMFVLTDFEGLEPGAWLEDLKTALRAWVRDHSAWRRFALVTDLEWVAGATRLFAWVAPGEVRTFGLDQVDEAKAWVAG
jgi:hypothetical protein